MNILIYFSKWLNPMSGGTERVAYMIAEYLRGVGHNVINLGCVKTLGWEESETQMLPDATEMPTPRNVEFLQELCKRENIDIIINESGNSDAIFLFSHEHLPSRIKIITHLHFDITGEIDTFYSALNMPLRHVSIKQFCINVGKWIKAPINKYRARKWKLQRYRYLNDNSDCVVTLSDVHKIDFVNFTKCEYPERVKGLINPLTYLSQEVKWDDKENQIIYVGRLDYAKRVDRALMVWRMLYMKFPKWNFVIIGDGPDRERLEQFVSRRKIQRVEFLGFVDPSEYYKRSKILILTSCFEGTPMVIGEAMANGVVPVVMDSFAGCKVMIHDKEDGMLTPYRDVAGMAEIIENLLLSPDTLGEMSSKCIQRISAANNNQILAQWEDLIKT